MHPYFLAHARRNFVLRTNKYLCGMGRHKHWVEPGPKAVLWLGVPEEDPILDAGSGPRPVSLSLVIGKFLDGIECENQQKGTRDCDGFQKQLDTIGLMWL